MIYTGYSGTVWQSAYAALNFYNGQLALYSASASGVASPTLSALALMAEGTLDTLNNSVEAIDTYALSNAWISETVYLQEISALDLPVDPTTAAIFNARLVAYEGASAALTPLIVTPGLVAGSPRLSVTASVQPVPLEAGVENVADHVPPEAENPVTVELVEQPPPQVAVGMPVGAVPA